MWISVKFVQYIIIIVVVENPDALVLDVKTGNGAFNKTHAESLELAKSMIAAGENAGKSTSAFITSMDQPLGMAVGNWLEVRESIETLCGRGPADLTAISLTFAAQMLVQGGLCTSWSEGHKLATTALTDGSALKKFEEMVIAQGGDVDLCRNLDSYPAAKLSHTVAAATGGFVGKIDTLAVGLTACLLGAGREKVEDGVDPTAGILLHKKLGDQVMAGEATTTMIIIKLVNKTHR